MKLKFTLFWVFPHFNYSVSLYKSKSNIKNIS